MKTTTFALLGLLLIAVPASAHGEDRGFGMLRGFGGLGVGDWGWGWTGDHHQGFDGLGFGFGLGLGFFDADRIQTRFENRFDSLMTQYNDGVAGSSDFFTSTEYDNIVGKTQTLDDRYGLFVSGVEHSIDRLDSIITFANDDVTFFNDLLAKYQADDSLSAARLDRITMWINHITDRLDSKITSLTEKQSTLQTNLPTYQSFQTDVSTFLSDIVAAGGGTSGGTSSSLKSLVSSALIASDNEAAMFAAGSASLLSPSSVPEPSLAALTLLASGGLLTLRSGRGRR